MDTAHRQMLTDSIIDKIMLIGRTADDLKALFAGHELSEETRARIECELEALRAFVHEVAQLSALEDFDYVAIHKVYERLDAVVARADAIRP
jgi:hypothetical protein